MPQGLYLRGEHNTIWGDNKLTFLCGKAGRIAVSAFFPTRGRESLMSGETAGGLLLDGKVVKIPANRIAGPMARNGTAMVTLFLDASETQKVLHAHTVGVSMQMAYDAPTFDGIADFDFSDGAKKMTGFMSTCK